MPQTTEYCIKITLYHIDINTRRSKTQVTFIATSIQDSTHDITSLLSHNTPYPLSVSSPRTRLSLRGEDVVTPKAAPRIRNAYLSGKHLFPSLKALTLYLRIYKSHKKMTKEVGRSQGVCWVRCCEQSRLFQPDELRVLMGNAKRETQLLQCEAAQRMGEGSKRRANEVRVCRNGGTNANRCETTMVSSRYYRTVVLWAHKDTL